jgi:RNA polymerase sigma-70 factor (ECF subfamily)
VNDSDPELVTRCLEGNADACREFVRRFQRMIFSLCFRMLGSYQDAEDAAQESLVRALRGLGGWDRTRSLKPWLLAIAANRCRTALMKRSKQPLATDFAREPEQIDSAEDRVAWSEELELALAHLKPEYRECFLLFHQHDLNCNEVGQVMGCPEGTVKTWLHRARRQLADFLRRRGIVGEPNYDLS